MKSYIKILVVCVSVLAQTSCEEDFIELNPISSANINSFYKNQNDFEMAIVGVYNVLQSVHSTMWT
jgi:hypothetical protein